MRDFTRRSFLEASAMLSAGIVIRHALPLPTIPGAVTCSGFNVVLHGLFVIDVGNQMIQISSPDCVSGINSHKHSYRAGSWQDNLAHFPRIPKQKPITPIWNHRSSGLVLQDVPTLNIGKMGKPDHSQGYLSLILPTPEAIIGVRSFDWTEIDYDKNYITATKFPLVTILNYRTAPVFPPIPKTPWYPKKSYHIFAEPEDKMDCKEAADHGKVVVKRLWAMFKASPGTVPLPKGDCYKPRDTKAMAVCISPDEEKALSELGKSSLFEAVHMPTCAVFIAA